MEEALKRFESAAHTRAQGAAAEDEAERWLRAAGYEILERNLFTPVGEIDVVAREGDTLCFVEVKARAGPACGPAIEAVHAGKQRRLTRAAALYVTEHGFSGPCRFDVLGLDREPTGWRATLIRNAFEARWR